MIKIEIEGVDDLIAFLHIFNDVDCEAKKKIERLTHILDKHTNRLIAVEETEKSGV